MSGLARFLREWSNPALKCERLGHALRERHRSFYVYPSAGIAGGVADRVSEIHITCNRCGHVDGVEARSRETLDGLTMDSDRWDELRSKGRIPA